MGKDIVKNNLEDQEKKIKDLISKEMENQGICFQTESEKNPGFINEFIANTYAIINRLNKKITFNANTTFFSEDMEWSNKYGKLLGNVIEKYFEEDETVLLMKEGNLYTHKELVQQYKKSKVFIVNDVKVENLDGLYQVVSSIAEQGWSPIVILCTTTEGLERLKTYKKDDFRLFHYLCGHKLNVSNSLNIYIVNRVIERLKGMGYEMKDAFGKKLEIYVQAVYPEAIKTKDAFVEDLIERIFQIHYRKLGVDEVLDEEDIPYSKKAEEVGKKKEISIPELSFEREDGKFSTGEWDKNILVLSMSTLPGKIETNYYCNTYKDKNEKNRCHLYSGVSQLEAGTKFLLSKLEQAKTKVDKIIVLTTKEAKEQKRKWENRDVSAIEVYKENISKYLAGERDIIEKEAEIKAKIQKDAIVEFDKNELKKVYNEEEIHGMIEVIEYGDDVLQNLLQSIQESAKNKADESINSSTVDLYLNLQGGSRTFMFTIFSALTLLRDKNVNIKEMFAVNYERSKSIHPIQIVTREYAIIDLVSGIRAFTRYGKAGELENFLQTRGLKDKEQDLLSIMVKIDENMQTNNPYGFTNALVELKGLLEESDESMDSQFQLIVKDLKEVYEPLLREDSSVLDQIKWFAEREFTTSALTFIEDKMPAFFIGDLYDRSIYKKTKRNNYKTTGQILEVEFSSNDVNRVINSFLEDSQNDLKKQELKKIISKIEKGKPYYTPSNNIFLNSYNIEMKKNEENVEITSKESKYALEYSERKNGNSGKKGQYKIVAGNEVNVKVGDNGRLGKIVVKLNSYIKNNKKFRANLDCCFRLYEALKKERNATNHADEKGENHMPYKDTRQAILVFVKLARELQENFQEALENKGTE